MNTIKWVVLLASLQIVVGCASRGGQIDGPGDVNQSSNGLPSSSSLSDDTDQDGIANALDNCADSTAGALVDETGCEIVTGVIEGLKFGPNETRLSVDSRVVLSQLVDVFLRYPDVVIAVEGHTDNRGSAAANLELSKQRVLSVVRYMVANGMNPDNIEPYGFGENRPRAANATSEGREQNRRIEIKVIDPLL